MALVAASFEATDHERYILQTVLEHNCSDGDGQWNCSVHQMIRDDRIVKRLIFVRRDVAHYLLGEWAER